MVLLYCTVVNYVSVKIKYKMDRLENSMREKTT